ncbi:MAG TPA: restriction endonuclease subunit S [Acidobacteriota bacterium]|nr:restriction endonuclease subunit S [Acidobacteriota bacterium]HQM63624.1 restriction endonuclease subunit S [Acidobacteriota bacterium]
MKKGWETRRIDELCIVVAGQSPEGKFYNSEGRGLPFYQGKKDFGEKFIEAPTTWTTQTTKIAKQGDILMSVRAPVGPVNFSTEEICIGRGLAAIRCGTQLNRDFLFYQLLHLQPEIAGKEGAVFASINKSEIEALPLAFTPLPEQQRIVGVLDETFAGLATAQANAEKNLLNARALFESHMNDVFSKRGEGWVEKTLGKIGKVSMCKRIFKEETTATGDIPFYKIGTFGKEPDAFISSQTYNEYRARYPFPKKGDILISASGTIGRRVRYDGEPAYFQDSNIVWIDNDERQVSNDYLYHFYGACEWNSTKGATISRLYNDNLRQIAIAFPESSQEQRRIVTQLDSLSAETRRLAAIYERKLAALETLKKSLLHQAFNGEL